ncbi:MULTISPECIES: hypothetical protein [unclassified Streptomyces]|uniref:Uncharacterized protein n=1 Tax=Streptomyces sp. F2 TaxID=317660 RepID=V9Z209_9ACTN|nr:MULTISPECIES: hypothetical protein [unclassified Streptomyces]AHE39575.1 Hypothetical protein pFRL4_342 [Streptomyces sp. F2]
MTEIPAPTGECFCGCGSAARPGNYFRQGHDKKAEGDLNALFHGDRVVQRLVDRGYGPGGENLHRAAIDAGVREACGVVEGCPASGRPGSAELRRHRATHTRSVGS